MSSRTAVRGVGRPILATLALAWLASTAQAAPIQSGSLISAGGERMTSGTTQLEGNLGDILVGPAAAGTIEVWSGFWTPPRSGMVTVEPVTAAPRFALDLPRPNPATATSVIQFSVPYASTGSLTIFDSQGRIIRRLFRGTAQPGTTRMTWDLRTDTGRPVPSGVYIYQVKFPAFSGERKLAVLR